MAARDSSQAADLGLSEQDFLIWTERSADLLRSRQFSMLDIDHLAEEIEDLGRSERHAVASRLRVLLMHLLKWETHPEHRSGSWRSTIRTQRRDLLELLESMPSLRRQLNRELPKIYNRAVEEALEETGLLSNPWPADCPLTLDQILDLGFLPSISRQLTHELVRSPEGFADAKAL